MVLDRSRLDEWDVRRRLTAHARATAGRHARRAIRGREADLSRGGRAGSRAEEHARHRIDTDRQEQTATPGAAAHSADETGPRGGTSAERYFRLDLEIGRAHV